MIKITILNFKKKKRLKTVLTCIPKRKINQASTLMNYYTEKKNCAITHPYVNCFPNKQGTRNSNAFLLAVRNKRNMHAAHVNSSEAALL